MNHHRAARAGTFAWRHSFAAAFVAAALFAGSTPADAALRVLPAGQLPADGRLQPLKDLDGYFPFVAAKSPAAWAARAETVRRQIFLSQGLWPLPTRTPLNPVIHGKIDKGEYTVEKAFFESSPGFFVTGNLYRPKTAKAKAPAVLFAHGHWRDARLSENTPDAVRREIAIGAERFEVGGGSIFQSLCVQLARMGCVVWQWDMLGDSDSQQLSHALVHRFGKQRPEMNTAEDWGFFSPQAESHLQSVMGLQTWNAIRSLDFLLTLPEVDPTRIAMTGASGGGTQTMLLAAVDPRLALSFPAVMVSTAMQGGCTCENSSLLRVNTGNIEFAALFAPKPQGMTTANDWTRELSTKGFPELQQHYAALGAPGSVMMHRGEHFQHNYNAVARSAFYTWVNRHFKLGGPEPVVERDYERLGKADLTVWNAKYPMPPAADPAFERQLARWHTGDAQKQIAALRGTPSKYREVVGGALQGIIGRTLADVGTVEWDLKLKEDRGAFIQMAGLLRNKSRHEELPALFLHPKKWNGRAVIWLDDRGKDALLQANGAPAPFAQTLLDAGSTVAGVDLLHQGEFLAEGKPLLNTGKVKNPREFAGFTFGYNHPVFASRVHDVLTLIGFTQDYEKQKATAVELVGLGPSMGPVAAGARALAGPVVTRAVIDTAGFRFGKLTDFHDVRFLHGGAKYDDVPGMLSLNAPGKLMLSGEGDGGMVRAFYAAVKAPANLTIAPRGDATAAARWLSGN